MSDKVDFSVFFKAISWLDIMRVHIVSSVGIANCKNSSTIHNCLAWTDCQTVDASS
jgi:hypothetical protein